MKYLMPCLTYYISWDWWAYIFLLLWMETFVYIYISSGKWSRIGIYIGYYMVNQLYISRPPDLYYAGASRYKPDWAPSNQLSWCDPALGPMRLTNPNQAPWPLLSGGLLVRARWNQPNSMSSTTRTGFLLWAPWNQPSSLSEPSSPASIAGCLSSTELDQVSGLLLRAWSSSVESTGRRNSITGSMEHYGPNGAHGIP